jgi:hypothetical protein
LRLSTFGTNIDYVIDGQNRRIGKKVNGTLVEGFLYRDQLQPAVWLNDNGTVRGTFIYGLRPNVPEYMVQGSTTYRLITDQVGTVRLVVNVTTGHGGRAVVIGAERRSGRLRFWQQWKKGTQATFSGCERRAGAAASGLGLRIWMRCSGGRHSARRCSACACRLIPR